MSFILTTLGDQARLGDNDYDYILESQGTASVGRYEIRILVDTIDSNSNRNKCCSLAQNP